jgi:ComF family protein
MDVKKLFSTGSCFFCQAITNSAWCDGCEADLLFDSQRCPVCARNTGNSLVCGSCLNQPPSYLSTVVLFNYKYPIKELIKNFKFNKQPMLSKVFAYYLSDKLRQKKALLPHTLVPVPLHKTRQTERGFNQSLELAKKLSPLLNCPLNTSLCSRIINTSPQSSLPMKTRRKNVRGAFSLTGEHMPKHIAIIDDVITTGSTANELATLFKKAGCERIDIWAIART